MVQVGGTAVPWARRARERTSGSGRYNVPARDQFLAGTIKLKRRIHGVKMVRTRASNAAVRKCK
jgi:hypothetical protein